MASDIHEMFVERDKMLTKAKLALVQISEQLEDAEQLADKKKKEAEELR